LPLRIAASCWALLLAWIAAASSAVVRAGRWGVGRGGVARDRPDRWWRQLGV